MDLHGQQFDVIVVGAGIMGSAAAYQLARRGKRVILLEQFDFLHHRGSSHGESRTIRAAYPEDYYCAMAVQSSRLWEEAESEIGYKVYFKSPHLDMGPAGHKSLLGIISSCSKNSIGCRVLDQRQVEEEFAGRVRIPEDWIGIRTDLGGVIKPTKAVSMFQTLAFQKGAVLRDHTEVKGILKNEESGGGVRVLIGDEGGEIRAEKCVITAGAWTNKLLKKDYVIDFLGEEFGKDVVVAGGFSGHGFKMGPAVGKILADLALHGEAKGIEGMQYFRIQRFNQPTQQ
ncbi:Probable sarcosine oxidase [Linum grandiflorum]